MLAVKWFSV